LCHIILKHAVGNWHGGLICSKSAKSAKSALARRAGEALAELALATATLPKGRAYASLVRGKLTYPNTSVQASNDALRDTLL